MQKIFLLSILMTLIFLLDFAKPVAAAAEKIIFVPHDDRPVSFKQTAEIVGQLDYEIILPPKELLGVENSQEHPEKLWAWLEKNASSAKAAVIASDSMLYGGLIPSRKHEFSQEVLDSRVERFKNLRENNPDMKIYIFGSLMRTPIHGTVGDIEEPEYYAKYGADIFTYTLLLDKQEIDTLNDDELYQLDYYEKNIPEEILNDWFSRRDKNFSMTTRLVDFARDGIIDYLVIGRDDNAPLSQTHRENRKLLKYIDRSDFSKVKVQSLAGIDEFNLLLFTRAVNELSGDIPFVNVQYNEGTGADTVPPFSDEHIGNSIRDAVRITGGMIIPSPKRADFVLLVHTDPNGESFWGHNNYPNGKNIVPDSQPRKGTKHFAELVDKNIKEGYRVGVADITFTNGSDNSLMKLLQEKDLLYKLQSYSGWNTATNSTGFALATGILSRHMKEEAKNKLLSVRYLDDWAYQANVRTIVGNELVEKFNDPSCYYDFKNSEQRAFAENESTRLMNEFAEKNLPSFKYLRGFKVKNPWNRMFECEVIFNK